jgi:hypothetical protein
MSARWWYALAAAYLVLGVVYVWVHARHARAIDGLADAYRDHTRATDAHVEQMKSSIREGKEYAAVLSDLTAVMRGGAR